MSNQIKWTKKELCAEIDLLLENVSGSKIYYTDREAKRLHKILSSIGKYKNSIANSNHFKVTWRTTKGRKYKCLNIVLHNQKLVPVTKTAIRKLGTKGPSQRAMILEEMRRVIEPQIIKVKRTELKRLKTFEMRFVSTKNIHIDHQKVTFIELACNWVISEGYHNFSSLPGKRVRGGRWQFPPELEESWYNYHKEHATLVPVEAKINLAEGARGFKAPF